jgi:hypothetical protein
MPTSDPNLSSIVSEQVFMRCLCAVLIERDISGNDDPPGALRKIVEKTHIAIDCYVLDRSMAPEWADKHKEFARVLVEGVAAIAATLLKIDIYGMTY